ncbi:MAG: hypothetical protein IPL79_13325 [Myxococcales bacterium]|nr:hypothetical protein [Myxococcales bacterium]
MLLAKFRVIAAPCAIAVALFASANIGCGRAHNPQGMRLMWAGENTPPPVSPMVAAGFAQRRLRLAPTVESRPDGFQIGVIAKSGTVVRGSLPVAPFVQGVLFDRLTRAGAQLLAGDEELVLASEILELNVTESERFEARVSLRLSLFYGQQLVWTHIYLGTGSQWGRDHDPDVFNEAVSEALDKVIYDFCQDDAFGAALFGEAAPALPPPLPPQQ